MTTVDRSLSPVASVSTHKGPRPEVLQELKERFHEDCPPCADSGVFRVG